MAFADKSRRLLQRIYIEDAAIHASIATRFPRIVPFVDGSLEWVYNCICNPAFAILVALLLVVLVATNIVPTIVAFAIGSMWAVLFFWIARSKTIRRLTILTRFVSLLAVAGVLAIGGSKLGRWALFQYRLSQFDANKMAAPIPKLEPCKIVATATSDMIERLYFRGMQPRFDREYNMHIYQREWFYEWTLTLQATSDVTKVIVTTNNTDPNERPRIVPERPFVTKVIEPHWKSGFPEPGRPPDFYMATFDLGYMPKDTLNKVVIRRPVKFTDDYHAWFPLNYAARDFDLTLATPCQVEKHNYDFRQQGDRVMRHFLNLVNYSVTGPDLRQPPFRINPDIPTPPLRKNETEAIVELRCEDDACKHPTYDHLEGRWGKREEWSVPVGEVETKPPSAHSATNPQPKP